LILSGQQSLVPLLLIVDDLPWIDRASAGVLGFVARRLVPAAKGPFRVPSLVE